MRGSFHTDLEQASRGNMSLYLCLHTGHLSNYLWLMMSVLHLLVATVVCVNLLQDC